jgi:glycosyltransferase involved in cell wall biosynthesis
MASLRNFRIVIVLPNLSGGGAERLHVNLANDWIKQGFDVEFILLRKDGDLIPLLAPEISISGLNVKRFRSAIFPLIKRFLENPPQLIVAAMWPLTSAVVIAWILSGRNGRLYLSEHENLSASYIKQKRVNPFLLKILIQLSYPLASGIICVSRGVKKDLCAIGKLSEDSVKVIYNPAATGNSMEQLAPINVDELWGIGFNYHILSVGRLTIQKDHETLIRAFKLLPKKLNAKLIILGEGPLRAELEVLIKQLKLNESVSLTGFVLDPYPWFRTADIFVLSSLWEGFGNVIVEALECGLPVISTNCPSGPSEILQDGLFGRLVPIKDPQSLALAIEDTLKKPRESEVLIKHAQNFSVRTISDEYLNYFSPKLD